MLRLSYRSYCNLVLPSLKWRLVSLSLSLSFSVSPLYPTRPGCRRWGRRAGVKRSMKLRKGKTASRGHRGRRSASKTYCTESGLHLQSAPSVVSSTGLFVSAKSWPFCPRSRITTSAQLLQTESCLPPAACSASDHREERTERKRGPRTPPWTSCCCRRRRRKCSCCCCRCRCSAAEDGDSYREASQGRNWAGWRRRWRRRPQRRRTTSLNGQSVGGDEEANGRRGRTDADGRERLGGRRGDARERVRARAGAWPTVDRSSAAAAFQGDAAAAAAAAATAAAALGYGRLKSAALHWPVVTALTLCAD